MYSLFLKTIAKFPYSVLILFYYLSFTKINREQEIILSILRIYHSRAIAHLNLSVLIWNALFYFIYCIICIFNIIYIYWKWPTRNNKIIQYKEQFNNLKSCDVSCKLFLIFIKIRLMASLKKVKYKKKRKHIKIREHKKAISLLNPVYFSRSFIFDDFYSFIDYMVFLSLTFFEMEIWCLKIT